MRASFLGLSSLLLSTASASEASASELVVNVGLQRGSFLIGKDIGPLNPHDYRPNEFVTSDVRQSTCSKPQTQDPRYTHEPSSLTPHAFGAQFVYEGLTAWDGEHTEGLDGIAGTDDDFVDASLATSWTTNYAAHAAAPSTTKYEITFTLRSGVTFHDGEPWNAAAAKVNFDQIMGGTGEPGGPKALKGMHDWMGFTQQLDGWSVVDDKFKLTFTEYYEAALRELAFIRPFRMISPKALPSLANNEISHVKFRGGEPRVFGGYTMRGVSAPSGTGPYKAVHKLLGRAGSTGTFTLPAADFNASCYVNDACNYADKVCGGAPCEHVAEVLFEKHAGHWKNPTYDSVILRAYKGVNDVKEALKAGTLHIAYGVQTLSPSAFLSLATADEGSSVVAHKGSTGLNTRMVVLNSGGVLNTKDLRKFVMGVLAKARQSIYDGELAEEIPMDTMFNASLPHCGGLSSLSTPAELAATGSLSITKDSITKPLRLLYIKDIPHNQMIAASVAAALYAAGIAVTLMPEDKDTYNTRHCDYIVDPNAWNWNGTHYGMHYYAGSYYDADEHAGLDNYAGWDIALSETWGPPYDATSKLWDMTHGLSGAWCSKEADAPAIKNMEGMAIDEFVSLVRGTGGTGGMSNIVDPVEREKVYTKVLTTLHDEAIFLPLTAKRQTAVTNSGVSGFKFGFMEFDLPLANLYPAPEKSSDSLSDGEMAGIAVGAVLGAALLALLAFVCVMIAREKQGKPIFSNLVTAKVDAP